MGVKNYVGMKINDLVIITQPTIIYKISEIGKKSQVPKVFVLCLCGSIKIHNLYAFLLRKPKNCRQCHQRKYPVGSKINSWSILEYVNKEGQVHCQCECGIKKIVRFSSLISNQTTKCQACYAKKSRKNFIGQKFGRWKVLDLHSMTEHEQSEWVCRCECGTIKIRTTALLLHSNSISCGCFQKELMEKKIGALNTHYNHSLTESDRDRKRGSRHVWWSNKVKRRDSFTCQKCQVTGVNLAAHHIRSYYKDKEYRYDIENGITFCEDCHIKFHKKYGFTNFKPEDTNEFLNENDQREHSECTIRYTCSRV